ncbi:MAG: hypothetical protein SH850_07960 [Planctomycetaceae bacterium]|nr:hypothetical protein [Planctomycetaceae bacterium]
MPRPRNPIPPYTLHRPSKQARVRLRGHDYYLGSYGSPDSVRKYLALILRYTGRTETADVMTTSR